MRTVKLRWALRIGRSECIASYRRTQKKRKRRKGGSDWHDGDGMGAEGGYIPWGLTEKRDDGWRLVSDTIEEYGRHATLATCSALLLDVLKI